MDLDVGVGDLNESRRNLVGFRLISLNSNRISTKSSWLLTDVIEIWSDLRSERGGVQLDRKIPSEKKKKEKKEREWHVRLSP